MAFALICREVSFQKYQINVAGDFGEEVVGLVGSLASTDVPKAVILGNHDAW